MWRHDVRPLMSPHCTRSTTETPTPLAGIHSFLILPPTLIEDHWGSGVLHQLRATRLELQKVQSIRVDGTHYSLHLARKWSSNKC